MKNKFFSEQPAKGYRESDRQSAIMADYEIVYRAMGQGHDDDRSYLADKYNRPINNLADLNALGQELFSQLNDESRAADKYLTERNLDTISAAGAALGSIKSAKKSASSRENGKKGGRPKQYITDQYDSVYKVGENENVFVGKLNGRTLKTFLRHLELSTEAAEEEEHTGFNEMRNGKCIE
jgi:hypothetical protein